MLSHSDDGHINNDSSVVCVPRAAIDPDGARPVYPGAVALENMPEYNAFLTPGIQKDDGPEAYRHSGMPRTKAIGSVPYSEIFAGPSEKDRKTTYSYLDCSYAFPMNGE